MKKTGFFAALFDLSFSTFITTRLISLIYTISLAVHGLIAVAILVVALTEGPGALMVLAPLYFLFMAMMTRIGLELAVVLFRTADFMRITAENTTPAPREEPRVAVPNVYVD